MSVPTAAMLAAWQAPDHTPAHKVEVMWDGVAWMDETNRVLSMGGVDGIDSVTREWQAGELTLVLSNEDDRFTPTNAVGPLYSYLGHAGQRVRVTLGWNAEMLVFGTYWVSTMSASATDSVANLRCLDRVGTLANSLASCPSGSGLTSLAFQALCTSVGLVAGVDFTTETGEQTAQSIVCSQLPIAGEFGQVAIAEGGRVVVLPDGTVAFWNATHHRIARSAPDMTIMRSAHVYDANVRRRSPLDVNRVLLTGQGRSYQVPVLLCTVPQLTDLPQPLVGGMVETGGATGGVWCQVEATDPNTHEVGAGAVITGVNVSCKTWPGGVAGSAINGVPPLTVSPSNTVYWTWSASGSTVTVRAWTVSSTDFMEMDIAVTGSVQQLIAPVSVQVDDLDAQATAGGKVTALNLANNYLPAAGPAAIVGRDLLSQLTGAAWVEIPGIDGMPFLRAYDCFSYLDDSVTPNVTYTCVVGRHEWSYGEQGYTSAITGLPGLTAQVPQLVSSVVPALATSSLGTLTPQAPPWYAGPGSSQDGLVGYSEAT